METTSKQSAHTPGPWTVDGVAVRDSAGKAIAQIKTRYESGGSDEHEANAALIAAAPELLECLELMDVQLSHLPDTAYTDYLTQRVRNAIKAAKKGGA